MQHTYAHTHTLNLSLNTLLHLASGYNSVCLLRAPWLADTTVRGPAALGQLVNAVVVHLDCGGAVLDLVVKVPKIH